MVVENMTCSPALATAALPKRSKRVAEAAVVVVPAATYSEIPVVVVADVVAHSAADVVVHFVVAAVVVALP